MGQSFITHTPEETEHLAAAIGVQLRGGECIELSSDLGGGKTTFTRGLAAGAGSLDQVASPTFTISKRYQAQKLTLFHYDFYRLQEPGLVAEELAESVHDPLAVSIIEWADTVEDVLPYNRLKISIQRSADSETARTIHIAGPAESGYLLEGIV